MKCDNCGKKTHIIYVQKNHDKLCDKCSKEAEKFVFTVDQAKAKYL